MEKKKKKKKIANRSKPSLGSLMSSLYDSISELPQLTSTLRIDGELSITGLLAIGATLKSIELQLQAIKHLLRQRKEAIPKGKISSFFNFATLIDIQMTKSEIDTLQGPIAHLTEVYMNLTRRLHPELFSDDANRCLLQEEVNNNISPESMVLSPSPTEDIRQNNQFNINNNQFNINRNIKCRRALRRESKKDNSWFGNRGWIGSCMKGNARI